LPHRAKGPAKKPRIEPSKKKEKQTEKFAVDNVGKRRNPGRDARSSGPIREMTDAELMGLVSAGMTEEESQRFMKTLPIDNGDDSASEVCFAFPRRIFGPFVLRNQMMPAQASSLDFERSEDNLSETSSVGGASFDSKPHVTSPAEKTVAKKSTATKAGQVRLFCAQPAPSTLSSARLCGGACSLHFGGPSVQNREFCRHRRRSLQEQLSRRRTKLGRRSRR
jgi:hypothetical protein